MLIKFMLKLSSLSQADILDFSTAAPLHHIWSFHAVALGHEDEADSASSSELS